MSTYFLHDGRNEIGPLTIDDLKKQKLTRNTPIRLQQTDFWFPAEKLADLKQQVAPRKIKRPKDIVPVVMERASEFKKERPKTAYAIMLGVALLAGVSIYSLGKSAGATPLPTAGEAVSNKVSAPEKELPAAGIALTDSVKTAVPVKEDKEREARLKWNKLITATNSSYGIGFLGGIKDLKVMVINRSNYPIDEAVVDLTYIKAGGGVWKSKPIIVYGIPPHESKEQAVPDVSRGKKVSVSLKKVVSKKMKFSYTAGKKGPDKEDPYFAE